MGARANYVVVDDAGYRIHYSHWGAQGIDLDLLPGPEHALRFVARQEPTREWLDDTWAEGAALVDTVRRELLWFGASEYADMLPYRRAVLAVLARTWRGWTVRWAHDELGDVVRHVGVPLDVVRKPELVPDAALVTERLRAPDAEAWRDGWWVLLTVRPDGGPVRTHAFDDFSVRGELVLAGAGLLDLLPRLGPGESAIRGGPPRQGLHVDVAARTVGWWSAPSTHGTTDVAPRRWPGWQVRRWEDPPWQDGYERHRATVASDVALPAVDVLAGLDELGERLERERPDPVADFAATTGTLRAAGLEVEVTAPVTAHADVEPDAAAARRVAAAVAAVRAEATEPPRTSP